MSIRKIDGDGNIFWVNSRGENHRIDGPALFWPDGTHSYWIDGHRFAKASAFQKAAKLSDEDMAMLKLKYGQIKNTCRTINNIII